MEKYCKNCGCKVRQNADFCTECGTKIDYNSIICKNCGKEIIDVKSKFCNNCGNPLKPKTSNKLCPNCGNEFENNRDSCPICGYNSSNQSPKKALTIIGIIVACVVVLFVVGSLMFDFSFLEDVEPQEVKVGSVDFLIPGDYENDSSVMDVEYNYDGDIVSQAWVNPFGNIIYISTMAVPYGYDADSIISAGGGVPKTLMGHDGYYSQEDNDTYIFTFEHEGYICLVCVDDPDIFDEISCLG